jgi:cellulose synthase/poly-beta-1,6-N-acetylglucosamine synthase-like glycosyltransferase
MPSAELTLALVHLALLTPLAVLGLHKAWMIALYLRARRRQAVGTAAARPARLPKVTVQLPVFNERYVVERLIRATAEIDYPRDLLEIQVLDDSTDDTSEIIARCVNSLPADLRIRCLHRTDRRGYKAGALEAGLHVAEGELLAVFDADFLPPPDFLMRTVLLFEDPTIGMVQSRWDHINPGYSFLTGMQALLLDGHFVIEHVARSGNGCFFNFNGTAGVFRRECIVDAGGWQHDTLTEDMDLSYRAQLQGWKFAYLPELACPAELPVDMNAFLTQQHRWAKGSVQTGRKLMGRIWRAPIRLHAKLEAVFHLFGNVAFPLLLAVILVAMPLQAARLLGSGEVPYMFSLIEGLPLLLATASVLLYYGFSQLVLSRFTPHTLLQLPMVLALGAGVCVNNTTALIQAMRRNPGEFRRTPKHNVRSDQHRVGLIRYQSPRGLLPLVELGLGGWAATTCLLSLVLGEPASAMFHGVFAAGLFWVGARSFRANLRRSAQPVCLVGSGSPS